MAPQGYLAASREFLRVYRHCVETGMIKLPLSVSRALFKDSSLDPLWNQEKLFEVLARLATDCLDQLGPFYHSLSTLALNKWGKEDQVPLDFTWPTLNFSEVALLLERELPSWHDLFVLEAYPYRSGPLAQVHLAKNDAGQLFSVKIIKPKAQQKLQETLAAFDVLRGSAVFLAHYPEGARGLHILEQIVKNLRTSLDLTVERDQRIAWQNGAQQKNKTVILPLVHADVSNANVLVCDYVQGCSLASAPGQTFASFVRSNQSEIYQVLIEALESGLFTPVRNQSNILWQERGGLAIAEANVSGTLCEVDRTTSAALLRAVLASDGLEAEDLYEVYLKRLQFHPRRRAHCLNLFAGGMRDLQDQSTKSAECLRLLATLCAQKRIPMPRGLDFMLNYLLTLDDVVPLKSKLSIFVPTQFVKDLGSVLPFIKSKSVAS